MRFFLQCKNTVDTGGQLKHKFLLPKVDSQIFLTVDSGYTYTVY